MQASAPPSDYPPPDPELYALARARVEREGRERYYQDGPPDSVDLTKWRLTVGRLDGDEVSLAYRTLVDLPQTTQDRRFVCVCAWSIRQRWTGILLEDVLRAAGLSAQSQDSELHLRQQSIGRPDKPGPYIASIPILAAIERRTLICIAIDGSPLSLARGFPARLIDFGLYGYKCVKGLTRLDLTSEPERGWWETERNYPVDGTIRRKRYQFTDLGESRLLREPGEVTGF